MTAPTRPHACRRALLPLALAILVAACSSTTDTQHGVQDLVGTPDLVVDSARLATGWFTRRESFALHSCSTIEGNFSPGTYLVLRFTVSTPNLGDADAFIGDPLAHIDPNGDGDFSDSDGLFQWAPCHGHFHLIGWATYELLPVLSDGSLGPSIQARKAGFCLRDDVPGESTSPDSWVYRSCGDLTHHGFQGIAVGWADLYDAILDGQFFLLTAANQQAFPGGDYVIRITVNPPYAQQSGRPCLVLDPQGMCRLVPESDYTNNVASLRITIPAQ